MLFWLLVFVIVIACICSNRKKRERELARLDQLRAERDRLEKLKAEKEQQALFERHERIQVALKEFQKQNARHMALVEKIEQMYAVAVNLMDMNAPEIDALIAVCREDIAILPFFRASWNCYEEESHREPYGDGTDSKPEFADRIDYWESYRRLAMIYEKRKDYQQAINVCREALANGITKDGSKGGFVGRAARMAKKLLDQNPKIEVR